MNRSIRKLIGAGTAALAIGGFFAVIVAPQLAGAASGSHRTPSGAGMAKVITDLRTEQTADIDRKAVTKVHLAVTTSTVSCTTAKANLAAAVAADKAEGTTERANSTSDPNFKTSDLAEDKAEYAARKPLVDAVRATCAFTKPVLSAQCTAALQALKSAFTAESGEDAAERTAGTEGSAGDVTEDQSEKAAIAPLLKSVWTACGFGARTGDFSWFGSTKTWSFQR